MTRVLRMIEDGGYLSNKRMALEIGVGLAHLSDRVLSLPVDRPIGWGPRPALGGPIAGTPSSLRDLYDLPVTVLGDDDYADLADKHTVQPVDWPDLNTVVVVDRPDAPAADDIEAFANGRATVAFDPEWDASPILDLPARGLGFYSYVFGVGTDRRRELFSLLEQIRPKQPYRDLAADLGADLGPFNAAHIRRTDHLLGIPQSRAVSPWVIRDTLASALPADERLVVCTEADPHSDVFKPLLEHFADVVFLTQAVLDENPWRERFTALEHHDDSALAVVSQEVAARADRFVGTFASTFTAIIHRQRRLADPDEPFAFTADYLGGGTRFEDGRYLPVADGPYSWNRLAYPIGPDALAWMREWPEVAQFHTSTRVPII